MLKIDNLSYKSLFSNINLEWKKWVILIYWPSGSWKTTFLKIIWWYILDYKWDIYFNWENIKNNILKYRKKNWFSFQNENLLDLDVKSNLELPFLFWENKLDKKWKEKLIKYFEIESLVLKNISELSWWEQQRISIIKSFIHKPQLVLLDEADSSLDTRLKEKFYNFLIDYSENNLIIMISHDENSKNKFKLKNKIYDWNFSILM